MNNRDSENRNMHPSTDWSSLTIQQGDNLPHWTCEHAIYHTVFRLSDALPRKVVEEWVQEREGIILLARKLKRDLSEDELKRLQHLFSEKIDWYMDQGHGHCWLIHPAVAESICTTIRFFQDQRYRLHAWCIMPNHVHVIVEPINGHRLNKIIHSWTSFSANKANRILKRTGQFWQHESYDHIIRSEREYRFQCSYVWENPEKAGLGVEWKWKWRDVPDQDGPGTT